jgi:hypothetical protein
MRRISHRDTVNRLLRPRMPRLCGRKQAFRQALCFSAPTAVCRRYRRRDGAGEDCLPVNCSQIAFKVLCSTHHVQERAGSQPPDAAPRKTINGDNDVACLAGSRILVALLLPLRSCLGRRAQRPGGVKRFTDDN